MTASSAGLGREGALRGRLCKNPFGHRTERRARFASAAVDCVAASSCTAWGERAQAFARSFLAVDQERFYRLTHRRLIDKLIIWIKGAEIQNCEILWREVIRKTSRSRAI